MGAEGERSGRVSGVEEQAQGPPFPLTPPKAEGHFGFATSRDNTGVPQGLSDQTSPSFPPWGTQYVPAVPRQGYNNGGVPLNPKWGCMCTGV